MTDMEKLLANERAFQRGSVIAGVALILLLSLVLSMGRGMLQPPGPIAAAANLDPAVEPIAGAAFIGGNRPFGGMGGGELPGNMRPGGSQVAGVNPLPGVDPLGFVAPPAGVDAPTGTVPGVQTASAAPALAGGPSGNGGPGASGSGPALSGGVGPGGATGPGDPTNPTNPTDPVSPVPEPMAWAMMILGIGMIGGALRASRRRPIRAQLGQARVRA